MKLHNAHTIDPHAAAEAYRELEEARAIKREHAIDREFDRIWEDEFQSLVEDPAFWPHADLLRAVLDETPRNPRAAKLRGVLVDIASRLAEERIDESET